eukprot:307863-Pyramimonas_sp.AAC.1
MRYRARRGPEGGPYCGQLVFPAGSARESDCSSGQAWTTRSNFSLSLLSASRYATPKKTSLFQNGTDLARLASRYIGSNTDTFNTFYFL